MRGWNPVQPVCVEFRNPLTRRKVRVITERNADDWLALALEYEADKDKSRSD